MKIERKGLHSVLKNYVFIVRIAFKEAPIFSLFTLMSPLILQITIFIEHTYMIAYLIDCVQYRRPFEQAAAIILAVFIMSVMYTFLSRAIYDIVGPKATERINKSIKFKLYAKVSSLDLACYDNPEFYNDFVWAMSEADKRIYEVLETLGEFVGAIGTIGVIGGYIITADSIGIIISIVSVITTTCVQLFENKKRLKIDIATKVSKRKQDYIKRVFYLNEYAKELRMGEMREKLYKEYENALADERDTVSKNTKIIVFLDILRSYIFNRVLFEGGYLLSLVYKAVTLNIISYGSVVGVFNSVQSLSRKLMDVSHLIGQMQQHSLYMDKMLTILSYENKITNNGMPRRVAGFQELNFEGVSFGYGKTPIINDLSFSIHSGEKIAIVGLNGAGKTTLIKLLMRLYDPQKGDIKLNGKSIKEYELSTYRELFGTIFQDFQMYATSLGNNIIMDNHLISMADVEKCLKKVNMYNFVEQLPNGLQTQVTREFTAEGVYLSGGEQQKVAISRCLYKDKPIIVMDEPASSLDPKAEYLLNETLLSTANDSTVVIISHRLATTKMVDKIILLENGEIAEAGTHDELMKQDGKYATLFNLQAELYNGVDSTS